MVFISIFIQLKSNIIRMKTFSWDKKRVLHVFFAKWEAKLVPIHIPTFSETEIIQHCCLCLVVFWIRYKEREWNWRKQTHSSLFFNATWLSSIVRIRIVDQEKKYEEKESGEGQPLLHSVRSVWTDKRKAVKSFRNNNELVFVIRNSLSNQYCLLSWNVFPTFRSRVPSCIIKKQFSFIINKINRTWITLWEKKKCLLWTLWYTVRKVIRFSFSWSFVFIFIMVDIIDR